MPVLSSETPQPTCSTEARNHLVKEASACANLKGIPIEAHGNDPGDPCVTVYTGFLDDLYQPVS